MAIQSLLPIPESKPVQTSPVEFGYFDGVEQMPYLEHQAAGIEAAKLILADNPEIYNSPTSADSPLMRFVVDSAIDAEVLLTAQKMNTAEKHYTATHDHMTRLLNVAGLEEVLNRERGKKYGVILADITNFKRINDSRSYEEGNSMIINVAKVLEASTRHGDYVARIGGDEFMILVNLDAQGNARRKGELTMREKLQAVEERIEEGTQAILADNPRIKKLGVDLATGVALRGPKSTIKTLKKTAERQMKTPKDGQHKRLGQYRTA